MRPQQQNRRMRGRNNGGGNNNNNNNRRGPNPLNRNYESNGPDVKIRGSAQQIAEKYATLARDAMSSGDRVIAENYLQHAEHYNRIIAAAQAQMPVQQVQQHRNDDFDDDVGAAEGGSDETAAPEANHGGGPQPVIDGVPAEIALNGDDGANNNSNTGNRTGRRSQGNHGQNGQRNGAAAGAEQKNGIERTAEAPEADDQSSVAPVEEPVLAAGVNLSPADLAAQVERNENSDETPAPRPARRPRRPRAKPAQSESAAAEPAPVEAGEG